MEMSFSHEKLTSIQYIELKQKSEEKKAQHLFTSFIAIFESNFCFLHNDFITQEKNLKYRKKNNSIEALHPIHV